jgi:TRAP-type C4-dicarboxylate transport system substrate-binding protein
MDKAQNSGVQIVETIDKQPFQDAVKPVWDKYGPRFAELVKRIQAAN